MAETKQERLNSKLIKACDECDIAKVESLINKGANVNSMKHGITPLKKAVIKNYLDLVKVLVKNNAFIELEDEISDSALLDSIILGHLKILKYFLLPENGISVNYRDSKGNSLLMLATQYNQPKIVEYLLDNTDLTEDHYIALKLACERDYLDIAKAFASRGICINITKFGNYKIKQPGGIKEEYFLQFLTNLQLFRACEECNLKEAEIAIHDGANVDAENERNESSLNIAIRSNCVPIVKLILKNKKFNMRNLNDIASLYIAMEMNNLEIIELVIKNCPVLEYSNDTLYSPLEEACDCGNTKLVNLLLDNGADVNYRGCRSPLTAASRRGYLDIVQLLVNKGANVNIQEDNEFRETPLICAVKSGNLDVVEYLVSKKANIHGYNKNGDTPLSVAREKNFREIIKFLVKKGAVDIAKKEE